MKPLQQTPYKGNNYLKKISEQIKFATEQQWDLYDIYKWEILQCHI